MKFAFGFCRRLEDGFTLSREFQENNSPICLRSDASHEPSGFQLVDDPRQRVDGDPDFQRRILHFRRANISEHFNQEELMMAKHRMWAARNTAMRILKANKNLLDKIAQLDNVLIKFTQLNSSISSGIE